MNYQNLTLTEYEKHYTDIAPNYSHVDDFSPAGPHYHRTTFFLRFLHPGQKVWDVGCSNGGLARYITGLMDLSYFASDIAPFFVQNAQRSAPKAICGIFPIERAPFAEECFDVVIAGEVLEHVLNINIALNQIRHVLKRGGMLLATTPRNPDTDVNEQHLRYLDDKAWKELLPQCYVEDNQYSWLMAWKKP